MMRRQPEPCSVLRSSSTAHTTHTGAHAVWECQPHTLLWQHNICICKHLKIKFFLKEKFHIFHKTSFLTLPPTCCQKTLTTGTVMCNYSDPWLPLPNPTPSSTVCVNSPGARNFHTYTDTHTSLAVSMQHTAPSSLSLWGVWVLLKSSRRASRGMPSQTFPVDIWFLTSQKLWIDLNRFNVLGVFLTFNFNWNLNFTLTLLKNCFRPFKFTSWALEIWK